MSVVTYGQSPCAAATCCVVLLAALAPHGAQAWPFSFSAFTSTSSDNSPTVDGGDQRPFTVALNKQYVPVRRGNRTVAWKTAYFGNVHLGYPATQSFTVVFDTGSGHFILPSVGCRSETCEKHARYNRSLSYSAVDVEFDGTPVAPDATERDQVAINFGTGRITGEFVDEVVCLGEPNASSPMPAGGILKRDNCVALRVVLATEMTKDPFELFDFDGVLGLGLEKLVLSPAFSFFGQMMKLRPNMPSVFAVYLNQAEGASEIAFGGHNPERLVPNTTLSWTPVASPELGYWQVAIKSMKIGDETLDLCADGSCRAILDTGTSLLGVPKTESRTIHWKLARPIAEEDESMDCRDHPGPTITFDLGDFTVQLDAQDYSRPAAAVMQREGSDHTELFCRASLLPVDMQLPLGEKVFIWGEPVLRRYYTAYDWAKKQVAFGKTIRGPKSSPPAPQVLEV